MCECLCSGLGVRLGRHHDDWQPYDIDPSLRLTVSVPDSTGVPAQGTTPRTRWTAQAQAQAHWQAQDELGPDLPPPLAAELEPPIPSGNLNSSLRLPHWRNSQAQRERPAPVVPQAGSGTASAVCTSGSVVQPEPHHLSIPPPAELPSSNPASPDSKDATPTVRPSLWCVPA